MVRSRLWIWIGLIIGVPLVIWALLRTPTPPGWRGAGTRSSVTATPSSQPSPRATPATIPPVHVERTAISTVDEQGRRQWDLRAEAVTVDGAAGTATLSRVEGVYFQAGEPAVTFRAPRGTLYIASRNVTLTGGVHVESTTGRTLQANVVRWLPKSQEIQATGAVVLRQPGMTVRADRLIADVALRRTRLTGNIRVTVTE